MIFLGRTGLNARATVPTLSHPATVYGTFGLGSPWKYAGTGFKEGCQVFLGLV